MVSPKSRAAVGTASACAAIAALIWVPSGARKAPSTFTDLRSPAAKAVSKEREPIDGFYAKADYRAAEDGYREIVNEHKNSTDPDVQDEVAITRIRLGYSVSKRKDFQEARNTFLEAERDYKGNGGMSLDFGGLQDQAAYQAAACLNAEGKAEEAAAAFRKFIEDYPLSPLVVGAHKRLAKLNGGNAKAGDDKLLQTALDKQQGHIRYETSVCGPKTIAYLLKLLKHEDHDYKQLAKLCGTNEKGTTLRSMQRVLTQFGLPCEGYSLNRKDFAKLRAPAILMEGGDHYVILLEIQGSSMCLYDCRYKSERREALPPLDDPDFQAVVLAFQNLKLDTER